MDLYQLGLVLQIDSYWRVELYLLWDLYQGAEFRGFVLDEEGFVLVCDDTMCAAYADFLHNHCRVAVSSYSYLVLAQAYQKYRESFVLRIEIHFLKDGVRWIGRIL